MCQFITDGLKSYPFKSHMLQYSRLEWKYENI